MRFTTYTMTLAAGESQVIAGRGSFVLCTSAGQAFKIRLDSNSPEHFENGIGFESPRPFDRVEIINTAPAGQTISVVVADGRVVDNRVTISGGISQAGAGAAAYGAVSVGVAATLIKAANTSRGAILLQNLGSVDLFVGTDNLVTAANGIKVASGGSAELNFQTTIYGICSAAAQDIRYLEETV